LRQVEVLVIFSFLATTGAVAEEPQMPGRRHASMSQLPAQKLHQPGDQKAGMCRVLRQGAQRRDQFRGKPLIGVQVQLPCVSGSQVVDCPVFFARHSFRRHAERPGPHTAGLTRPLSSVLKESTTWRSSEISCAWASVAPKVSTELYARIMTEGFIRSGSAVLRSLCRSSVRGNRRCSSPGGTPESSPGRSPGLSMEQTGSPARDGAEGGV